METKLVTELLSQGSISPHTVVDERVEVPLARFSSSGSHFQKERKGRRKKPKVKKKKKKCQIEKASTNDCQEESNHSKFNVMSEEISGTVAQEKIRHHFLFSYLFFFSFCLSSSVFCTSSFPFFISFLLFLFFSSSCQLAHSRTTRKKPRSVGDDSSKQLQV